MKSFLVKLTIRKMGMQCRSCKQSFECEVIADSNETAVVSAKLKSGANPETHKFSIDYVREVL